MLSTIQEFIGSKKWVMTLAGIIAVFLMQHFGVTQHTIDIVATLTGAYVGAQGIADFGKGAKPQA